MAKMTTSARMMHKETEGEPRCNAAAPASLERDISAGHIEIQLLHGRDEVDDLEGDMAEIS